MIPSLDLKRKALKLKHLKTFFIIFKSASFNFNGKGFAVLTLVFAKFERQTQFQKSDTQINAYLVIIGLMASF